MQNSQSHELAKPEGMGKHFREIARVWLHRHKDGGEELAFSVDGKRVKCLDQWSRTLTSLAHEVATVCPSPDGNGSMPSDLAARTRACIMLNQSAELTGVNEMVAHLMLDQEQVDHEGRMPLAEILYAIPDAEEVLTVWRLPELDCEGCDETHESVHLALAPPDMNAQELGDVLGQTVVSMAAAMTKRGDGNPLKLMAVIEAAIHQRLAKAMEAIYNA